MNILLLLLAVGGVWSVPVEHSFDTDQCGYKSCHKTDPGVLNVHIVPHTHDDVGWLKTVDQYYYGSRNMIQKAGVQYILDSVVKELWEDPKRRFIYVETAFFWKWWVHQSPEIKEKVHTLVKEGRLQFVGGAWSMNDEAASHYQSVIDQFTWGLSKLNKTFGPCARPRVGWQIDPFGHSRELASLLAMMGYDGLFLGRIDYQDKARRLKDKAMEMVWRGNDDLGKASDIFTGALYNTYSPPAGFCFDVLCADEPIITDPDSPMYNVVDKVQSFLKICAKIAESYRSNNILITMGEDFNYQDAAMWFINLDKLIEYTNLKAAKEGLNVTLFYSTPDCYLKAVKDANPVLPTKADDFFPYASDPTAYWTGYFTSRPTTKFFERESNGYLQMVKQLQVLADLEKHNQFVLNELKSAMGVMQHHDAITGTEKQHVAHDYERLLNQAVDDALIIAKQAFNKATQKDGRKPPIFDFHRCHLNESRCDISENSEKFVVTVYNPLGWPVKEPIRVPVAEGEFEVWGPNGQRIKKQQVILVSPITDIPTRVSKAMQEIVFIIHLKPLSYKSVYIKRVSRPKRNAPEKAVERPRHQRFNIWKKYTSVSPEAVTADTTLRYNMKVNLEKLPLAPMFAPQPNADLNASIYLTRVHDNAREVVALEKFLRQPGVKPNPEWDKVTMIYSTLSQDQLNKLAKNPPPERYDPTSVLENQYYKVHVECINHLVREVILPDHTNLDLGVNMYYYPGACGDNHDSAHRASGAYIFRPTSTTPVKLDTELATVVKGEIVKEFRIHFEMNAFMNLKVYDEVNFIEVEWVVGPIPIADQIGKEYVIKYETNILNNGEFYTDSNGRQKLKRKLNTRPTWNVSLAEPVAGNYYPVTNEIYIKNDDLRLTVIPDRSEGGTSLVEGEIEMMLHRRLLCDDAFGVGEALNETAKDNGLVVRGKHRLYINRDEEIPREVLRTHLGPQILFSDAKNIKYDQWLKMSNCHSWLAEELPPGLHLLTLEPWESKLLIRIENYLEGQNSEASINLKDMFQGIQITSFKETLLAANMFLDEYTKWTWQKENEFEESENRGKEKDKDFNIVLKGKEIRTFIAEYEVKNN
ncbi:unnamed protein product [Chrysodeixis includens]|uniref:Alpha-mannosidase n=1 Tax=Chrysodeixis includens TaxID=689277 RepID=A0A9N8L6G7_CHRIL|nr:unnamed protein product [Chrysodeixis includens]